MGVAWVNGHWLQIGIAIGAGLVIYLLLSLLRRIALKHAQSTEGDMTLTHIAGRVIHKTKSLVLAIIAVRLVAGYAQPPAVIMQIVIGLVPVFITAALLEGFVTRHTDMPLWLRSEEHTSELQSLMRISYAVFCLKKKRQH